MDNTYLLASAFHTPLRAYSLHTYMHTSVLLFQGACADVANAFVEKGVENTYLLAGGFAGVCVRCPHILSNPPPVELSESVRPRNLV